MCSRLACATHAQSPDPPVQLTWVALMSTAVELSRYQVSGLAVCVPPPRFFVPSVKATQEILCSLRASPVSTTRRRSVNSGQSHRPCLPTTKTVGEYVLVTTCRESHRLAGEKNNVENPTNYCDCKTIKEKSKITASKQQNEAEMCGSRLAH